MGIHSFGRDESLLDRSPHDEAIKRQKLEEMGMSGLKFGSDTTRGQVAHVILLRYYGDFFAKFLCTNQQLPGVPVAMRHTVPCKRCLRSLIIINNQFFFISSRCCYAMSQIERRGAPRQ
jgi:hypothetical protein